MIEIVEVGKAQFRFQVINKGGKAVFKSVVFNDKAEINPLVKGLPPLLKRQGIVERRTDHQGMFHFCLRNTAGKVIGKSIAYESEAGMENAIKNLYSLLQS